MDFITCYLKLFKILKIANMESLPTTSTARVSFDKTLSLTELMNTYGSDKGIVHGYTDIYEDILAKKRQKIELVLEIGIGTNDPMLPSSMGKFGKPGASLRAWRDYLPNAQIIGLDIDKNILFSEKSITTNYVDQLSPKSFNSVKKIILKPINLVIVDGLHTPRADFNSLVELLPLMSSDGDFFIEDVGNLAMTVFWPPILLILKKGFNLTMYKRNEGNLIHISRKRDIR